MTIAPTDKFRKIGISAVLIGLALTASVCLNILGQPAQGAYGEFELRFEDGDHRPLHVRLHVRNGRRGVHRVRGLPFWHDHMAVKGRVVLKLPPGDYEFEVERGLEYRDVHGTFQIRSGATDNRTLTLHRIVDLSELGWWSGDLLVRRKTEDLKPAMLADDLHFAAVYPSGRTSSDRTSADPPAPNPAGWQSIAGDRWYCVDNLVDARAGGRLGVVGASPQFWPEVTTAELPSSAEILVSASRGDPRLTVGIDAAAWDLPLWLASGRLNTLMVLGPTLCRDDIRLPRVGWRPRDADSTPSLSDEGRWAEYVYYQALNAGLRLAPVAGSGSGEALNPIGYNRVYAFVRGPISPDAWMTAVRLGQVVVTNGPLMEPRVNGELPGHVFRAPAGQRVQLQASLTLYTREPIDYLEIIQNGRVREQVPLARWLKRGGKLPKVEFQGSGWMVIRAVTRREDTYRVALTGPFYVKIEGASAVHRDAITFFQDWLKRREAQISVRDPPSRDAVLRYYRAAAKFWQSKLEEAQVD